MGHQWIDTFNKLLLYSVFMSFIAEPFTMGLQCYRCPETHEDTEHGVLPACSNDYFGAAYLCKVRTLGNKTYPAQGCIKGMRGNTIYRGCAWNIPVWNKCQKDTKYCKIAPNHECDLWREICYCDTDTCNHGSYLMNYSFLVYCIHMFLLLTLIKLKI